MLGHEKLIAMRQSGIRPKIVFVNDFLCQTDWFEDGESHVTISVCGENLDRLDLRFLVGLTVSAGSFDEARAKALMQACQRAGAATVGACHALPRQSLQRDNSWCEVWRNPAYAAQPAASQPQQRSETEAAHG